MKSGRKRGRGAALEPVGDGVDDHVRRVTREWPEIDPEVEGVVARLGKSDRLIRKAAKASLARVGLTHEEFGVLISLWRDTRSHGALCRELMISTGAMTNRLDKLERLGLLARRPDPADRRGVLLELTPEGRRRLDDYIALQAGRERQLLDVLAPDELTEFNRLLGKLLRALQSEVGAPPKRAELTTG